MIGDRYRVSIFAAQIWRLWPAWRTEIPPGRYRFFNLWFISDGEGKLTTPEGTSTLTAGTCALLRPWGDYRARHNPAAPVTYTRISFYLKDDAGRDPPEDELPPLVQHPTDWHLSEMMLRKVVHAWAESSPQSGRVATDYLQAFLSYLEYEAHRQKSNRDAVRLQPAIEAIRENPGNHHRVDDLARRTHLSRNQFTRLFKRATGETPAQYSIKVRMELACQLLTGDHRIKEIAEQLGYPDIFTFSRQFARKTGASPSDYRREQRRRREAGA